MVSARATARRAGRLLRRARRRRLLCAAHECACLAPSRCRAGAHRRGSGAHLASHPAGTDLALSARRSARMNAMLPAVRHYRTIWISDIHLGTRGCKAEFLLDFLRHTESDHLYLVGDIVDGWRLRRSWYWAQSHNDVVQKLLRKARKGTRVVYVPGNHDEMLRDYTDMQFGGVIVLAEAIHETADGRRLLILHGDDFDGIVKYAKWLAMLGDQAYNLMIAVNHWFNW